MIIVNGTNVETEIKTEPVRVGGGIRMANGAAPVVNAEWGSIEGNIQNQTDLMTALNAKADTAAVQELAGTVATKLTTPAGQEGQFMVYESGAWKGKTVATWQGGDF